MHQTTVRFDPDLWDAVESECSALGVSAAQFLREAAVARLAYAAGQRGDSEYDHAFVEAGIPLTLPARTERADVAAGNEASEQVLAATAVSAQSAQVWKQAREVRERSIELRRQRRARVR